MHSGRSTLIASKTIFYRSSSADLRVHAQYTQNKDGSRVLVEWRRFSGSFIVLFG